MGLGDWLMAIGEADKALAKTGMKTTFRHPRGHVVWEPVFDLAHSVSRGDGSGVLESIQGGGVRPYIFAKSPLRWVWRQYKPTPANLSDRGHRDVGAPVAFDALIEPSFKVVGHMNKNWGAKRWEALATKLAREGLRVAQFDHSHDSAITYVDLGHVGVTKIKRGSVASSLALMRRAVEEKAVAVLPEGGLHHLAAAAPMRAVVIYGGFITPQQTGYDLHVNLYDGGEGCGMRTCCKHCELAMARIEPEQVLRETLEILKEGGKR